MQYRLGGEAAKALSRGRIRSGIPLLAFAVAVGVGVSATRISDNHWLVFSLPLIAILIAISFVRSYRRQRDQLVRIRRLAYVVMFQLSHSSRVSSPC